MSDDVDLLHALANQRRTHALTHTHEQPNQETTIGDLADHIAALENQKPASDLTAEERKRVYIALYQCHLPMLDNTGLVDFTPEDGTVRLCENDRVRTAFNVLAEVTGYEPTGSSGLVGRVRGVLGA
jgi:hypothetical protein